MTKTELRKMADDAYRTYVNLYYSKTATVSEIQAAYTQWKTLARRAREATGWSNTECGE